MNLEQYIDALKRDPGFMANVTNWTELPARPARYRDFPEALDRQLVEVLNQRGIHKLYCHQSQAVERVLAG